MTDMAPYKSEETGKYGHKGSGQSGRTVGHTHAVAMVTHDANPSGEFHGDI